MPKVLKRIANSRKSILATITLLGDAAAAWGFDLPAEQMTEGFLLYWNAFGALLIAAQGVIDTVQGSPSDKAA